MTGTVKTKNKYQQDTGPVDLRIGKVVGKRWQIIAKLGEGGCGSVYKVRDIRTMAKAALKAESNFIAGGSVLKLEVQILKRLQGRRYVAQLLRSAKKALYSYMVMTLFGHSLNSLLKRCNHCSTSTQIRVGVNILYGIKQLHEVGFVHRDIKPANLAVGRRGKEVRIIHILDFGLAREFILNNSAGFVEIRPPRSRALFRGTIHYCSTNTHARKEQGRADDLWSMLYVLAEMKGPLPWDKVRGDDQIGNVKRATSDSDLFHHSPEELIDASPHVRSLDYFSRPDYHFIYRKLAEVMSKRNYKQVFIVHLFSDPFDWEKENPPHQQNIRHKSKPKSRPSTESRSTESKKATSIGDTQQKAFRCATPRSQGTTDSEEDLFQEADFEKNELGF
ncbi:Putative serine/threonine-protein kinase K06H7.1 [Toxocara canis]|uniref:Putative serine/threonine-protein kinase K06H7.1 n=1 Tax=Toxocara canis TaxID=6265 RepID=A0A0B2VYE1_TOXCA|nr:Putative serine/threonine-protein kinase K06H7.1 [Toxocara canis]